MSARRKSYASLFYSERGEVPFPGTVGIKNVFFYVNVNLVALVIKPSKELLQNSTGLGYNVSIIKYNQKLYRLI